MFAASKTAAVASAANYIEDVFSTYLYTGNSTTGGTQTITNNIDLSTKGGMVWIKGRNSATNHILTDTARGVGVSATNNQALSSNLSNGEDLGGFAYDYLSAFNSNGFAVTQGGTATARYGTNYNGTNYCSWTFRKQQKFFDIVTYTGNGGANRAISHNLGSVPGAIIIKEYSNGSNWPFYHRSIGSGKTLLLNDTGSTLTNALYFPTTPTATDFYVSDDGGNFNTNGETYVAYLFAHDAGGFGASGTDNVISCGSYTGNGSATGPVINLGYEPQWVLVKNVTSSGYNWYITDTMRGFTVTTDSYLAANLADAELTTFDLIDPTSTGFAIKSTNANYNQSGATYIYIAIRRGPMKTPTSGTSVFAPVTYTGDGVDGRALTGAAFPPDMALNKNIELAAPYIQAFTKLTAQSYLSTNTTNAETVSNSKEGVFLQTGITISYTGNAWSNRNLYKYVNYFFGRAPGFFDVVCYTGTGVARTISHNLGVAPELMIVKNRTTAGTEWAVYAAPQGATKFAYLNDTAAFAASSVMWNDTAPTSSVFTVGTVARVNGSGNNLVAYLFATLSGVSKVGSYTGTGTTKQIDCGFAAGARFVLIKRTDSTGDWYVWDSARGIVAGNDPYLLLNSTAAEVTNTDYVDTYSAGFEISSTAPAAINANGGTFIFLAIA